MKIFKITLTTVLVSSLFFGCSASVNSSGPEALEKGNKQNGKTPGFGNAEIATTYAEARYAICTTNSWGKFMVDLSYRPLQKPGPTKIRLGLAYCDGKVEWYEGTHAGSVTQDTNGYPDINFYAKGDGHYSISSMKAGTGLNQDGYISAAGLNIYGTENDVGRCYFLKTPTVKNLSQYCK